MRLSFLALFLCAAGASAADDVDFTRDVQPILSERCYTCHGPDANARISELRFDTEEGALAPLRGGGVAIDRDAPGESALIERVSTDDPARRMPPAYQGHDKLPEAEIEVLRRWIAVGAPWARHWSFVAPERADLPKVAEERWAQQAIDRFVFARLAAAEIEPSPRAERETLARRVSLDLTGLPPTREDVAAFVNDSAPGAYERMVDRKLASPHYGERMATPWLDAARYADTNGYQTDGQRSMWRWRDWVITAFNANKPFDAFTVEQIAGDLLPDPTLDQRIATAFHRNVRTTAEGGSVEEEFLAEYAADRVATTGTVWLGLTLECARCHDHKYDPVAQKEFYQLFAFFNNVPERGLVYNFGNDEPKIKAPTAEMAARLAELDGALAEASAAVAVLEAEVDAGLKSWRKELQGTTGDDWFVENGLVAEYSFEKSKAGYADWDDPPDSYKKGSNAIHRASGKYGQAAVLKPGAFVDLGDVGGFDYNEAFTFSFWLYPESENGTIFNRMRESGEGTGHGFFLSDGRLRFELTLRHTDLSMRIVSQERLNLNEWQHVAITFTGELPSSSGARFYIDGKLAKFDIEWDDLKWPISYTFPFKLGAGAGKDSLLGRIDELRVYRRSLDGREVAVLALDQSLNELAAEARSGAGADKLRMAYLAGEASKEIQQAIAKERIALQRRDAYYASIPTVMVMAERAEPRETFVLNRGAYDAPGEPVARAVPVSLHAMEAKRQPTRLDLAKWLVARDNPLTARVTVNRLWAQIFGTGLVKTLNDFGAQGERPSHPKLLDWLAVEFMESGWDVKALVKQILLSETYRQSSRLRPEVHAMDPENRLLARGARYRLPAEMVRDQALAASGLLNDAMYGAPVKPYQPEGLWREVSGARYEPDAGEDLYRRSLYTYWKRTVPPPSMVGFDAADRESCRVDRPRTNTPLQALTLMNDTTYVEAARKLGERMMMAEGDADAQLQHGFELLLARAPNADELEALRAALDGYRSEFRADKRAARNFVGVGSAPSGGKIDARELAAYSSVASILLNLDEAVTRQ